MKTPFCKVTLDFSDGSAYEYKRDSDIPTKIEYVRYYSGKFQKGKIVGNFSNIKLHDIIFLIKRGSGLEDIEKQVKLIYT